MSSSVEAEEKICACCGITEIDEIKLNECPTCQSVRYCSDKCQEEHRQQHSEECEKRRYEVLFRQPESTHLGDCQICFLPLPLDRKKYMFYTCCSKDVCKGCIYANVMSNINDLAKAWSCPFCRTPGADDKEENRREMMKRIEANDPAAMAEMGGDYYREGDYSGAFNYFSKAAKLGDLDAHYQLGVMYREGNGVGKDEEKEVFHLEKAAVGGHPGARHNLGVIEGNNGSIERAVKHFIIAANLGWDDSMKALWKEYSAGHITKKDLESVLRTHQAAVDATKSSQREKGEAALQNF